NLGVDQPIGFFLHTPWPARCTFSSLPHHREIVEAMLAFNLIGFQTDDDCKNFADYVKVELGVTQVGDRVATSTGFCRLATFPIGIDADEFAKRATKAAAGPVIGRLRQSLQGSRLAIGADRVDYSKGLPNRLHAFDRLLTTQPAMKGQVSYL